MLKKKKVKNDNSKKPDYDLPLTTTQINQINTGKRIIISETQLHKIKKKGIWPSFT